MPRERTLAGAAVAVLAIALLLAAVIPGVIAEPRDEGPVRPGPVRVAEITVQPGEVGGATAELRLAARLDHRGNPARNVSVRFRAIDAESGLLAAQETVTVGNLSSDGEVPVETTLRVDREGGYVLETTVFRDGERIDEARQQVSGMEALTPEYARTTVGFTESRLIDPIAVSVRDVTDNRTTLRVSASLTNDGDDPSEAVRVEVRARQADSNLVADTDGTRVDGIRPGRTQQARMTVTVPSNYNYVLDVALYTDGVLVDTVRSVANLDPSERVDVNTTRRDIEFEVRDFEEGDGSSDRGTEAPAMTPVETEAPGFTGGIALLAVLTAALLARRYT